MTSRRFSHFKKLKQQNIMNSEYRFADANGEQVYIYIFTYGGCGSKMLLRSLIRINHKIFHSHMRDIPKESKYLWGGQIRNTPEPLNLNEQKYVLYIYKDPVKAIYSRLDNPAHLKNLGLDPNIKIEDLIREKKDLYKLEEYFDIFTQPAGRDYPIYCIKYDNFFDNIEYISEQIGLKINKMERKETIREYPHEKELREIYKSLDDKIAKMPPLYVNQ